MLLISSSDVEESIEKLSEFPINSLTIVKFSFNSDSPNIDSFESIIILNYELNKKDASYDEFILLLLLFYYISGDVLAYSYKFLYYKICEASTRNMSYLDF